MTYSVTHHLARPTGKSPVASRPAGAGGRHPSGDIWPNTSANKMKWFEILSNGSFCTSIRRRGAEAIEESGVIEELLMLIGCKVVKKYEYDDGEEIVHGVIFRCGEAQVKMEFVIPFQNHVDKIYIWVRK